MIRPEGQKPSNEHQLDIPDVVSDFDIVEMPRYQLWVFMTARKIILKKGQQVNKSLDFVGEIVINCFPGDNGGLSNQKLLVVSTDKDVYITTSTSNYNLITFSLSSLRPKVLTGHRAAISSILHIHNEFIITTSEDNSVSGWSLSKPGLIFKFGFLFHYPASIIAAAYDPADHHFFFACCDLSLSTFDSTKIESLCRDQPVPYTKTTLADSLTRSLKLSDFVENISYTSKMLMVSYANKSISIFELTETNYLYQLIRFNTRDSPSPRIHQLSFIPGYFGILQSQENPDTPTKALFHIEQPRVQDNGDIEVETKVLMINSDPAKAEQARICARVFRGCLAVVSSTFNRDSKVAVALGWQALL